MADKTQEELDLLERLFLRLGAAQTDDQLEKTVATFLTPLLLKVSSNNENVKKKVMELLTHINKRLKSRPKVQLPVEALLNQYQDTSVSSFVTNFTILYLRMGYPRLEESKQIQLVPELIKCMFRRPVPQQECIMQLVTPVLSIVKVSESQEEKDRMFLFKERPEVAKFFLDFLLDVLLLPYSQRTQDAIVLEEQTLPPSGENDSEMTVVEAKPPGPPAGLSFAAVKRVMGEQPIEGDNLEQVKLGILKFFSKDVFEASDVICHFVVATGDSRHSVGDFADHELKRVASSTDWEKADVVNRMCSIFLGTVVTPGSKAVVSEDHKKSPAGIRVKQKIFPYLLRSRRATDHFPACIQIVFDSLFGAQPNLKLRINAVQFVHHMCLCSSDKVLGAMGQVLLSGMTKLVDQEKQHIKLRSLAFIAIGKLARRLPSLFSSDIGLVQKLFQSICEEEEDTRLAVQETLSMMAPAYRETKGSTKALIEALILSNVEKDTHQARLVAVQFANTVFLPTHIPSRYVCMLAVADVKDDVRDEAKRGLRLIKDHSRLHTSSAQQTEQTPSDRLPPFTDIVNFVAKKAGERLKGTSCYTAGHLKLAFSPTIFTEVIRYLRRCLSDSAGVTEEDEVNNESLGVITRYLQSLLDDIMDTDISTSAIGRYLDLLKQALQPIGGADLHAVSLHGLLEIVAAVPSRIAKFYHHQLYWLKGFTVSNKQEAREYAGRLLGIVVSSMGDKTFEDLLKELSDSLQSQSLDIQHGAATALGFLIARYIKEQQINLAVQDDVVIEDVEMEDEMTQPSQPSNHLTAVVAKLVSLISHRIPSLSCVVCDAVGEIGRNGPLPLPDGEPPPEKEEGSQMEVDNVQSSPDPGTKLQVVTKLLDRLLNSKENKVQERSAHALGYLLVGEPQFVHRQRLIDGLCEAGKIRQVELQFTVGEALSCAGAGMFSQAARDPWTIRHNSSAAHEVDPNVMKNLIETIVTKYSKNPIPYARQASCVWLLALVKYSGKHQAIQDDLRRIQMTFMSFLAELDDLTQEVASKGLGLVYELGGEERREELVSLLVDTLTTGRRQAMQVTGETQVFAEGELGKAPEGGGGLSTYKELCSLASDLNQPDLIYKFMHLANHDALWNSRKGAAFGFTSIAAHSREQLEPHLPKIIPKLYRYQFDPNVKIQQAMSSIWAALVPESKKTVDKYLKEILKDLVLNLNSNLWRVRQSSCMAVSDLLSGRSAEDVLDYMPRLWELCLRARDGIKETVRQAADAACRRLSKVSIQICDVNHGKIGEKAIALVLPTLLDKGLGSSAEEVRAIALSTILKISKNAGTLLKPHISVLVIALLQSLSELEPQSMNYMSLHLHKNEDVQEKLESARIAASKMSPMMETINMCVQYVDETVLPELVPRLSDLLRRGVGLGTKVGSSSFTVSLCLQCPQDLTPYSGKLLSSLLSGLSDRSASVRKSYATSIGHMVKVSKDSSVEKLIQKIKNWYFEKEDPGLRMACGLTFQAMTRYSPDIMKRHLTKALPTAYFAMHEKKKADGSLSSSESVWEEIWIENTPGTEGGLRLYLNEIVEITCPALSSQAWPVRAQAANTITNMTSKLGSNLKQPHLGKLLGSLVSGLTGRTWTGKEALLDAIKSICKECRSPMESSSPPIEPSIEQVVDAIFKECKKENPTYRQAALLCFGQIVDEYSMDRFQEIADLLFPLIDPEKKEDEETEAEQNETQKNEEKKEEEEEDEKIVDQDLLGAVYTCLGQTWPKNSSLTQESLGVRFSKILSHALSSTTWKVQVVVLRAHKSFLSRLKWQLPQSSDVNSSMESDEQMALSTLESILVQILSPVCEGLENKKYAAVRLGSLEVLETLYTSLTAARCWGLLSQDQKDLILDSLKYVYNDKEPRIKDKAIQLKKKILGEST
ncbi:proteasome adapter and scaffold protein ECM29-like [Actinia tenebrosa]|uniref:Proteasome adapter and scaffold protein ECM29-like n=1 Tax=Actinia tenebrosa TaxID=6105 RepID=A0A6P8HIH0_ACTTE|nr:proteasome adapter and scaffold protein ECM29-like [Actinia tenebrosa]